MIRTATLFALTAVLVVGAGHFGMNVKGQEKKVDDKKIEPREVVKSTKESKALQELSAAYTLARLGGEKKAPELILAAARVIGTTDFAKIETKSGDIGKTKLEEVDLTKEAMDLIAEAKKLGGDADWVNKLAAVVTNEVKEHKKGAVGGPKGWNGHLEKGFDTTDTYYVTFRGGEPGLVEVKNFTNKGDIDLYVYGPGLPGGVVSDIRRDDDAAVYFNPPKTAQYRIVVKAYAGNFPMRYRIQTN